MSYEQRPAVNWSISNNTFICPDCGKPLYKIVKDPYTGLKINVKFTNVDMAKKAAFNSECPKCGNSLWGPVNKDEKDPKWIKLGEKGWILTRHITELYNRYASLSTMSKKEADFFYKLSLAKEAYMEGDITRGLKSSRKYSIAKYIKDRLKFDYIIVDEMHQYKSGDSAQGQAMADIVSACDKMIGATGTLLNGYADGLFYILYRIYPKLMKEEGFLYEDEMNFTRKYGVIKTTNSLVTTNNATGELVSTKEKKLPGVSPLVFTKFLLENAVFLSLSDLDGGLPGYTEHPIAVDMDEELAARYNEIEDNIRRRAEMFSETGRKIMGKMTQVLSSYPDCPYGIDDITDDYGNTLVEIVEAEENAVRNKETELLNIVREKVEAGEKVLVYCSWTQKTEVQERLNNLLNSEGIKSFILKSSVSASKREAYIQKQSEKGFNVMICNPTLVETGLDLLEYTTIIFYQMAYNVFTMRQASRRSWRLSQDKDVNVYFLYYKGTIQETAMSLMATKLQASMALEGNMGEEGLRALSNNEDMLSQIAQDVVNGIKDTVTVQSYAVERTERIIDDSRIRTPLSSLLTKDDFVCSLRYLERNMKKKNTKKNKVMSEYINNINMLFSC